MRPILAGAALTAMLFLPLCANAQQGRQQTDDQAGFSNNVKALPHTAKRHHIIRSELSTRTNRGHNTMGAAPR
jgi:hypothetical protein